MIKAYYLVYDCETGGLYWDQNPITQFACSILDPYTLKEVDRFETYIKPYADLTITKEALEKTMCSMADIKRGIDISEFVETLAKFLKKYNPEKKIKEKGRLIPVGHNIDEFDNDFLYGAFALFDYEWHDYVSRASIDTLPIAKLVWGKTGDEKINLTACCERAGIEITDAHGAANDVAATAELLRYFRKKLQSKKGDSSTENKTTKRKQGNEFFEFKCVD
jgi:DNA polymerase III alpha subunit (gram-positive type)